MFGMIFEVKASQKYNYNIYWGTDLEMGELVIAVNATLKNIPIVLAKHFG